MERPLSGIQDESRRDIVKHRDPSSDVATGPLSSDPTSAKTDDPSELTSRLSHENYFSPEIKGTSSLSEYDWPTLRHDKKPSQQDSDEFPSSAETRSSDTMHLEYALIGLFAGIVLLLLLCQIVVYWKTQRGRISWTVSGRRRFCRCFRRKRNFVCSVTIEKNPAGFRAPIGVDSGGGALELGRVGLPCRPSLMFNPRPKMIVPEYEYRTGSATSNISSIRRTRSRPYQRPTAQTRPKSVSSSSVYVVDARGSHLSKTSPFWSYPPAVVGPSSLASDSNDSSTTTTSNRNHPSGAYRGGNRGGNRRRRLRKAESCGAVYRFKSHLEVTRVHSDVARRVRCHAVVEGGSKEWSSDPGRTTTSTSSNIPSNELSSKDSSVSVRPAQVLSEQEITQLTRTVPGPEESIESHPSAIVSSLAAKGFQKTELEANGAENINRNCPEEASSKDDNDVDGCNSKTMVSPNTDNIGVDSNYDKRADNKSLNRRTSFPNACEISKSANDQDKGAEGCTWQKPLPVSDGGVITAGSVSSSLTSVSSLHCVSSASCN